MKIMLALLTTNDIPRLERLLDNVRGLRPVDGVELKPVVVVNSLEDGYYDEVVSISSGFPVVETESNGKPGRGKNSCMELFLESDCDFLSQMDGDDILYPTYLQSLVNHINHYPCIDVLGILPVDVIENQPCMGHAIRFDNGKHGGVWGVSVVPCGSPAGPGRSHIWDTNYPSSVDFIILQSRKAAQFRIDEDIPVAEDHLYTYQLLEQHQKGELCYFLTMSSDMYAIDRTTEGSIQKQYDQADHVEQLREKTLRHVPMHRSSAYELPIMYKELLIGQYEKEEFLRSII